MDTTGTKRALRVVHPGETPSTDRDTRYDAGAALSTEDYWARMQELRADRERLSRAN